VNPEARSRVEVGDARGERVYTLGAMPRGWARTLVVRTMLVIVVLALASPVTSAWAHPPPAPPTEAVGPTLDAPAFPAPAPVLAENAPAPPAAVTIWLAAVLTLALGLGVVAPRRTLGLALVLVLGVLALETGVHSVHHLADRQAAAECAVASATAHVPGAPQPTTPDIAWLSTPLGSAPLPVADRPGSRSIRPNEGRAPPVG
jgi:hypothetical protein